LLEILTVEQGKKTNKQVVGSFGEEIIDDNGAILIDTWEQNSLKILNGYFKHKKIHQYTWHQDTLELNSIILVDYIDARQNSDYNIKM